MPKVSRSAAPRSGETWRVDSFDIAGYLMGMAEYSEQQKRIIDGYYRNLDGIMLAKLQELVGELYLADSAKKRERLWKRIGQALVKLKIKPGLVEHIVNSRDPAVLAANLEDWLRGSRDS